MNVRVFVTTRALAGPDGGPVVALRVAMTESGVSTRDLERATGVSRSMVSKVTRRPGGSIEKRKAEALAAAVGRRYDDLFISKEALL